MELNLIKLIAQAGPVVKLVMLILFVLSIVSWQIILIKIKQLKKAKINAKAFLEDFWNHGDLNLAQKKAATLSPCPPAHLFLKAYQEYNKSLDAQAKSHNPLLEDWEGNVERSLSRSITSELAQLESKTPFLATVGSAAPFIGLFGTVWGIMNSFLSIGSKGAASLAVVAPGISEALIATAIGLFAAIPAVVGYNYCQSQIRFLQREMENFASDLLNALKRLSKRG